MIISVNKAMNILMVLSDYVKPVSLKVIAERTDLNKGTCVRILVDSCEIAKKRRLF